MKASQIAKIVNDSGLSLENARKKGLLPMNVKAARSILKEENYDYDRGIKKWTINTTQTITKNETTEVIKAPTVFLNENEVIALKQLAQQIINGNNFNTEVIHENPNIQLYERTRIMKKDITTRKTYVVSSKIAERFDKIAERSNIDKSQLLTLAIEDFLNKYEE